MQAYYYLLFNSGRLFEYSDEPITDVPRGLFLCEREEMRDDLPQLVCMVRCTEDLLMELACEDTGEIIPNVSTDFEYEARIIDGVRCMVAVSL